MEMRNDYENEKLAESSKNLSEWTAKFLKRGLKEIDETYKQNLREEELRFIRKNNDLDENDMEVVTRVFKFLRREE